MRLRSRDLFKTIHTEGGLLPADLLQRVAENDRSVGGLGPTDYHLGPNERLTEAITRSWTRLTAAWRDFDDARAKLPPNDPASGLTRDRWLHPLFDELGYGRLLQQPAVQIQDKAYPVFSQWHNTPIHLIGAGVSLDARTHGVRGAAGQSPHSLVQELLNRSPERLWGMVSNGLALRLLRDNVSLTRQAYVQFDLEGMFSGEVYSDFVLLWLVCHQSRVEADKPQDCWLERWTKTAADTGTRALDALRQGVEQAIQTLGGGFLAGSENRDLHLALQDGTLSGEDYYRTLLRLVYRLLFLFVAEDRGALLNPSGDPVAQQRYRDHYSTAQLRDLAAKRRGGRHHDRYQQLKLIMSYLHEDGCEALALPALGSYLWEPAAIGPLATAQLANEDLFSALRSLATVQTDDKLTRTVDFRNLGAEELGSIYESLLELHPRINRDTSEFKLEAVAGSERKTTGSYYTPTSLISALLDTALDPVLDEAAGKDHAEQAILELTVVDPACGSGHFLIAAANRIAKRLAAVRSDDPEPTPEQTRAALRDVVGHCIHGVDINPMAVELCKVSLWMEALEPGRPLSFLDHKIVLGNSLLGTTPELIAAGIPDDAFKPILGDDRKWVVALRKRNKQEREGQLRLFGSRVDTDTHTLAEQAQAIAGIDDSSLSGVRQQQRRFDQMLGSAERRRAKLAADIWCTAFVAPKGPDASVLTQDTLVRGLAGQSELRPDELAVVSAGERSYSFLHWHVAFPAVLAHSGFDVVLGKPPWDQIQVDPREFFAVSAPEIAAAPTSRERERLIQRLDADDPTLAGSYELEQQRVARVQHFVHASGVYQFGNSGRLNTAPLFTEEAMRLTRRAGRAGLVVPTSVATDSSNQQLFRFILESRRLHALYDFENHDRLFPGVHSSARFSLLVTGGPGSVEDKPRFAFFTHNVGQLADPERQLKFSVEQIRRMNPNTSTCPVIRSRRDARIVSDIYDRLSVIRARGSADGDPWGFSQLIMFQANVDSKLMRSHSQLVTDHVLTGNRFVGSDDYWPLLEAKMLGMWDHRAASIVLSATATVRQGQPAYFSGAAHADPELAAQPRHWVPATEVDARLRGWDRGWLLCIKDITSATNERTVIGSFVPRAGVERSAPIMMTSDPLHAVWLAAVLFSFVGDYVARNKIGGTHLTLAYLEQLPAPPPEQFADRADLAGSIATFIQNRVLELAFTATDLAPLAHDLGYDGAPFGWDTDRRALIRAELDAVMFRLYKIERDDVEYIMDTFPIVKRRDEERFDGEYRTKCLILERYDAMVAAENAETGYESLLDPPPGDPRAAASLSVSTPES
jgi:hypothetical protein